MAKATQNSTTKASLGLAVQTRDSGMISVVVQNAINIVTEAAIKATGVTVTAGNEEASAVVAVISAPQPSVPSVETVHGAMPLTAIFDEDTRWAQVEAEYADLVQKIAKLPEDGKALAVAKLIAGNAVLRNFTSEASATVEGLI